MIAKIIVSVCICICLCNVVAGRYIFDIKKTNMTDSDAKDLNAIIEILRKPRLPEKYQNGFKIAPTNGFSWKSCGRSDDIVTFDSMSVKPDELVFPGDVTVSVRGKIHTDLPSPIQVVVDLKKKVSGSWVSVPCVNMMGSCTYPDICQYLQMFCPAPMPCKCPFKAGPIDVPATKRNIPYNVPDGDYSVNVKAAHNDKEVFCLDMSVAIG